MTTRIEALEAVAEAARRLVYSANVVGYGRHHDWIVSLRRALTALDAAPAEIIDAAAERAKTVAWLREVADGSSGAHFRSTLIFAADAIERGEYDKAGDEK